jgi:8-oxo-dGTP diphosphatase
VNTLVVAAAVVERDDAFLLTRRLQGTHLAGSWEFPGGKCEPGESLQECLRREILEELGASCTVGEEILHVTHEYPDRRVVLHFFSCALDDEPTPRLGQAMQWVRREQLREHALPPADAELIDILSPR